MACVLPSNRTWGADEGDRPPKEFGSTLLIGQLAAGLGISGAVSGGAYAIDGASPAIVLAPLLSGLAVHLVGGRGRDFSSPWWASQLGGHVAGIGAGLAGYLLCGVASSASYRTCVGVSALAFAVAAPLGAVAGWHLFREASREAWDDTGADSGGPQALRVPLLSLQF